MCISLIETSWLPWMKYHGVAGLIGLTPTLCWFTFLLDSFTFICARGSIKSSPPPPDPELGVFWLSSSFSRLSNWIWHFSSFSARSSTDANSSLVSCFFSRFFEIHSQILECSLTNVFVLYWHSFASASSWVTRVSNCSHMANRSKNIFLICSPEILTSLKLEYGNRLYVAFILLSILLYMVIQIWLGMEKIMDADMRMDANITCCDLLFLFLQLKFWTMKRV